MSTTPREERDYEDGLGVDYVGPFEETCVVINGRRVPHLGVSKDAQGVVRFVYVPGSMIELPPFDPDRPYEGEVLIKFMANCIAVGMGYVGIPDDGSHPVARPDFPRMIAIDEIGAA